MLSLKVVVDGLNVPEISQKRISALIKEVSKAVRDVVIKGTPRDTGQAARSWTPVKKDEGGFSFSNPWIYVSPLEFGSKPGQKPWPSPGPRTAMYKGRIYSSQAPGGIIYTSQAEKVASKIAQDLWNQFAFQ